MTPAELGVLTELAAVRHLLSSQGKRICLRHWGHKIAARFLDQAGVREKTLVGQLEELLNEVYVHHGEFCALESRT